MTLRATICALVLCAAAHPALAETTWVRDPAGSFDKPLRTVFVPLAKSRNVLSRPAVDTGRHCFYFPGFMVKEVDLGDMGIERLSLTPGANPPCSADTARERDLTPRLPVSRFIGVKGTYAVFVDVDGHNGGVEVAIFHAPDGRKLFSDDAAAGGNAGILLSGEMRVTADGFIWTYSRNYVAPCLIAKGNGCWSKVAALTGLAGPEPAACLAVHDKEVKGNADARLVRSVIAYQAQARYAHGRVTIAPSAGTQRCGTSD